MTVLRIGICALVAFGVLAHGAVEPWSESVLLIGAVLLLLHWSILAIRRPHLELVISPLYAPLLAIGAIGLAQLWLGVSVYPYLTKIELLRLAACFILFFLMVQVFRRPEELRRLVWFLLWLGFAVAVFAIVQYFTFNQKLYWTRELPPGGNPFGPYVNRNHFAGMMELIIPLGLAILLLRPARRDQLPLIGLFTIVPIGALFLSASRGGISSFLFQLILLGGLVWMRRDRRGDRRSLAVLFLLALSAGAFILWLDIGQAILRFSQTEVTEFTTARRAAMVRDTWRIFLDHPWLGTGLGTLVSVYPGYESFYDGKIVDHAHNDYLELMADTGGLGALSALAFVVLLFGTALVRLALDKLPWVAAIRVGALVACAGLMLHGLADFNLHITANLLLFLLLAALATGRTPQPAPS